MWLKKKRAGSASGGFEWENDGDTIEVPDRLGRELLELDPNEFEEDTDRKPSDDADSERRFREVAEDTALAARHANESPGGTKLQDGRWAQTDSKGAPVDTGVRDTGAEMAPANVLTASHPGAHKTLTPGSSENKTESVLGGPGSADEGGRHEAAEERRDDAKNGDQGAEGSAKGEDKPGSKPAQSQPAQRPASAGPTTKK